MAKANDPDRWIVVTAPSICQPFRSIGSSDDVCGNGDPRTHVWRGTRIVCGCADRRLLLANRLDIRYLATQAV